MAEPLKLVYSYARADEALRDRLAKHLAAYERDGLLKGWHDRKLQGGAKWKEEIDRRIGQADIVLLLISPDYIGSEWCFAECELAMTRHDADATKCKVIPINLRTVEWWASLKELNAIPPLSKPIMKGMTEEEQNEAFRQTALAVKEVAEALLGVTAPVPLPVPQPSPQPAPQPAPSAVPLREITMDFAFLCNWSDQETQLRAAFLSLPETKRRTPFLTMVCGHPDDCQEDFVGRIRNSPLPRLLGEETVNPVAAFDWPARIPEGVTADTLFTWKVAGALELNDDSPAGLAGNLQRGLTIIRSTIDIRSDAHEEMIESYARFWDSWPALPPGKALAPCLCIKGEPERLQVEGLMKRIRFTGFERLRGTIVALLPVEKSHALNWLTLREIRSLLYTPKCVDALKADIDKIFARENVRMKELSDDLTGALQVHAVPHICPISPKYRTP